MKRTLILTLALAVGIVYALGLAGCGDDETTEPGISEFDRLTPLGDTYFTSYTTPGGLPVNITAPDVYAILTNTDATDDPYILDWRGSTDFTNGHIAGAVNVSVTGNIDGILNGIPAGKTVLNVCYTGQTASYATSYMNMLGYDAQNLKFGMCGWTADQAVNLGKWDNAISSDYADWLTTVPTLSAETYPSPHISTGKSEAGEILRERARQAFGSGWKTVTISALYEDITINNNGADYFILNYFVPNPYDAGHIPNAVRFEPKEALRADKILNTIPTDKKVVVYCYTGQTSAQVMAYLSALGYDAYTLKFGVNGICYSNDTICTTRYHEASTNYPVVTGS